MNLAALIGMKIRKFRNEKGFTLEELSFKSGLNAAHLGQIERGLRNPTIDTLERICSALEINFLDLINNCEDIPVKSTDPDNIRRKIDAQLSSMTLDEQKDILRIIRIFRRRSNEEDKND